MTTKGLNEYDELVYQDATIRKEQPKDPAISRPHLKIWASGGEFRCGGREGRREEERRGRKKGRKSDRKLKTRERVKGRGGKVRNEGKGKGR